jgi:hypothetical protein
VRPLSLTAAHGRASYLRLADAGCRTPERFATWLAATLEAALLR